MLANFIPNVQRPHIVFHVCLFKSFSAAQLFFTSKLGQISSSHFFMKTLPPFTEFRSVFEKKLFF